MTPRGMVAILALCVVCFCLGDHYASLRCTAKEAKAERQDAKQLQRKSHRALDAGIRAQQAQDATDAFFQQLQSAYETDQQNHPGTGCVLDPVSLQRWNAANAQSDSATAGEPDDTLPENAAGSETGGERGE